MFQFSTLLSQAKLYLFENTTKLKIDLNCCIRGKVAFTVLKRKLEEKQNTQSFCLCCRNPLTEKYLIDELSGDYTEISRDARSCGDNVTFLAI